MDPDNTPDSEEFRDMMAQMRAAGEAANIASKDLATMLWAFYSQLICEGFRSDAALVLTVQFLQSYFMMARGDDSE